MSRLDICPDSNYSHMFTPNLNVVTGGVAIGGFDVVAYQTLPAGANGTLGSRLFACELRSSATSLLSASLRLQCRPPPVCTDNLTSRDMSNSTGERMQPTAYEFRFASAANLATFAADPWRYTPAWGGF